MRGLQMVMARVDVVLIVGLLQQVVLDSVGTALCKTQMQMVKQSSVTSVHKMVRWAVRVAQRVRILVVALNTEDVTLRLDVFRLVRTLAMMHV